MTIWLNGRNPPYMESNAPTHLSADHVRHAVACMTYTGRSAAAAVAVMVLNKLGCTPAEIINIIGCDTSDVSGANYFSKTKKMKGDVYHEEIF